jgi:hypothetical protein
MRSLLTAALLFCSLLSAAQDVPGYMGRRLIVGYSNYFFPRFAAPGNPEGIIPEFPVNLTHCLNIGYVLKKHSILELSLQRSKTGIATITTYDALNTYEIYPVSPLAVLKTTNIGLGFKFTDKNKFAPVGKYRKLELILMLCDISFDTRYRYLKSGGVYTYVNKGTGEISFRALSAAYTLGRSRVLYNRVVLDYGIRFAASGKLLQSVIGNVFLDDGSGSTYDLESNYIDKAQVRLMYQQLINLHIGIGFLAF